MIEVAGQSEPRLLSWSSRPAAAVFRVDQDAHCAAMSESGPCRSAAWFLLARAKRTFGKLARSA